MNAMTKPSLEEQLERAEFDLVRADYTESTAKMQAEKDEARARIAEIKRQMQQREMARQAEIERAYVGGAVEALGDRHAG